MTTTNKLIGSPAMIAQHAVATLPPFGSFVVTLVVIIVGMIWTSHLTGQESAPPRSTGDILLPKAEASRFRPDQPTTTPTSREQDAFTNDSFPGNSVYFDVPKRVATFPIAELVPSVNSDNGVRLEHARSEGDSMMSRHLWHTDYSVRLASFDSTRVQSSEPQTPSGQDGGRLASLDGTTTGADSESPKTLGEYKTSLQEALAKINQNPESKDATNVELMELIKQGLQAIDRAIADQGQRDSLQKQTDSVAAELAKIQIDNEAPAKTLVLSGLLSIQEMQSELANNAIRIENLKKRLSEVEHLQQDRPNRLARLTTQWEETKTKLADAEKKRNEADRSDATRFEIVEAQVISLRSSHDRIQKELEWLRAMQPLLAPQVTWLQRELAHEGTLKTRLEERISQLRRTEAELNSAEARQGALQSHELLRTIAGQNAELADKRKFIAAEIELVKTTLTRYQQDLERITNEFADAEVQVADRGNSQAVGLMLRQQLATLPQLGEITQRHLKSGRDTELIKENLELLKLQNLMHSRKQELAIQLAAEPDSANLIAIGNDLLDRQTSFITPLIQDIGDLILELSKLDATQKKLVKTSREFRFFIDKNILWIRSAASLGFKDLHESQQGLVELTETSQWKRKGISVLQRFRQTPWLLLGVLASLTFLFLIRGLLIKRLKLSNSRNGLLRIVPVFRSVLLTVVLAAIWPGVIATVAWLIYSPLETGTVASSISHALSIIAPLLFLARVLSWVAAPQGLGNVHLQWPTMISKSICSLTHRIAIYVLPFIGFCLMIDAFQQGAWSSSLGRIAFLVAMAGLFYAIGGWARNFGEHLSTQQNSQKSYLWQWRLIWMGAVLLAPVSLMVVSAMGWHYSAVQLGNRLLIMILVTLTIGTACCLIYRIACIGQHLVVERRRWLKLRAKSSSPDENASVIVDDDLDVKRVMSQVAGLMKGIALVLTFATGWLLWSDVLPAARFLDEIQMGMAEVEVSESITEEDGTVQTYAKKVIRKITLADWMICAGILIITFMLSRNIPGVLEVVVLNRLPIDRGGRYAVSVICRYVVGIIGIVIATRMVGFSWHNVQWLVAAMGVGLGFGLQEIFANVVSGLIILLERPVRIGDFVTVNGQTGYVTRVQLRATTILDHERREIVIPNKKFITDDVINWTLTDPITRIMIPVGIAYGSDTALAHATLIEVATDHPLVMNEPAPVAIFASFGSSTLDFELRVYLASRDIVLNVRHDLLLAIDRAFRDRNIEIAFPQQDIHIRSVGNLLPTEQIKHTELDSSKKQTESNQKAA